MALFAAACNDESRITAEADEYAQALEVPPFESRDRELRVWTLGFENGLLSVRIVTDGRMSIRSIYGYNPDGPLRSAPIEVNSYASSDASRLLENMEGLRRFNGRQWVCPAADGGRVLIEGMSRGRRFALVADNPGACEGTGPQLMKQVLQTTG